MKNRKEIVTYQNEFVDKFVLDYKQKELDLFFAIIFQMQRNSKIIEFQKEDIKKSIKTSNLTSEDFTNLIKSLSRQSIRYKTMEQIIDEETGKILANPGAFVTINFFDMLIEEDDKVTIKIKKEFQRYFFEIQENLGFSKHELQDLIKLSSRYEKLLFILLNRWKTFNRVFSTDFEEFKIKMNIPKSYKNNDVKRMIEKAKANIEKNTKIKFEFEFIKKGRKVEKINFYISNALREMLIKAKDENTKEIERRVLLAGLRANDIDVENLESIDIDEF